MSDHKDGVELLIYMTMAYIPQFGVVMMEIAKDVLEFDGMGMILMNHMAIQTKGEILYGTLSQIF